MADIGTDHGQLPVFLCEQGRCPHVIMTDVSEGSLAKARVTGYRWLAAAESQWADMAQSQSANTAPGGGFTPFLEARLGDGLAPLACAEADTVVMAGIGGALMERILTDDSRKSKSMGRYILQPRRSPGELRRFLAGAGYVILDEKLIPESKFIWEIIVAAPAESRAAGAGRFLANEAPDSPFAREVPGADDTLLWEIPSYYGQLDDPLMDEYLARKLAREERNLAGKLKAGSADENGTAVSRRNIAYIEHLAAQRKVR